MKKLFKNYRSRLGSKQSIHRKRSTQIEKRDGDPKLSRVSKVHHIIVALHRAKRRKQKTAACVRMSFTGQ